MIEKFNYCDTLADIIIDVHEFYFFAFIIQMFLTLLFCAYTLDKLRQMKPKPKIYKTKDIYCFECEIEMPSVKRKGNYYCTNCGLVHKITEK